ncbi:MAG: hypothetical protein ACI9LO_000020 [Planctomycetota bacterium]|jgi:hypothetical protein
MSKLDRFLAPWVFVITGIIFNILSALIAHYFIGLNNDQINVIDRDIQNKQVLIDSLWQSKNEVERKKEFFILLLDSSHSSKMPVDLYYQDYLQTLVENHHLEEFDAALENVKIDNIELLINLSGAAQQAIIESINSTYFESLGLEERKHPLEKSNSRLFSIAIFLQLMGLILVLAKDFRRR